MASNGSFETSDYNNRNLVFSWWVNSQSISGNYTDIGWSLVGAGSKSGYYMAGAFKVIIDGEEVYYSDTRIQLYNGTTVASGTKRIYHNSDGNRSFSAYAEAGIYYYAVNVSGSDSWDLTQIPRQANLTSAPNFSDEQNPTINYSNPAGNSVNTLEACISLTGSTDDISYRAVSKTGSSYTFSLTETERNTLRNACTNANSRSVIFYLRTIIGNNTYYSTLTKTLSIVNANPTFADSNVTYEDTNSTTVEVTENNQKMIQGLSTLVVTTTAATAKKGASITSYSAVINNVTRTRNNAGTFDFGTINSSNNLELKVTVTDSRGNTTTIKKTITFIAWVLPSANISLSRLNNYEDTTYLKVKGTYSSVESKNVLTITYQYKKTTDANYSAETTIANNTQITLTCDKNYAWDFKIKVSDKFGTATYNAVLAKGKFIVFYDVNKLSVGINGFPEHNESLEIFGSLYLNGSEIQI